MNNNSNENETEQEKELMYQDSNNNNNMVEDIQVDQDDEIIYKDLQDPKNLIYYSKKDSYINNQNNKVSPSIIPLQFQDIQSLRINTFHAIPWKLNLMSVSYNSKYLFTAETNQIWVRDTFNPNIVIKIIELDTHDMTINQIRLGILDGEEVLVSVDEGGFVRLIFVNDFEREPIRFYNDGISTWGIAMCPSKPLLAVSANNFKVTIWNLNDDNPQSTKIMLPKHKHNVPSIDFSPCGNYLLSVSIDKHIRVWDVNTGKLLKKQSVAQWCWCCRWLDLTDRDDQLLQYYENKEIHLIDKQWRGLTNQEEQDLIQQQQQLDQQDQQQQQQQQDDEDDFELQINQEEDEEDEEDEENHQDNQDIIINDFVEQDEELEDDDVLGQVNQQHETQLLLDQSFINNNNNNNNNNNGSDDDIIDDTNMDREQITNNIDFNELEDDQEDEINLSEQHNSSDEEEEEDQDNDETNNQEINFNSTIATVSTTTTTTTNSINNNNNQINSDSDNQNKDSKVIIDKNKFPSNIIFSTYQNLYLSDIELDRLMVLTNCIPTSFPIMQTQIDRIAFLEVIPELSLVIAASQGPARLVSLYRIYKESSIIPSSTSNTNENESNYNSKDNNNNNNINTTTTNSTTEEELKSTLNEKEISNEEEQPPPSSSSSGVNMFLENVLSPPVGGPSLIVGLSVVRNYVENNPLMFSINLYILYINGILVNFKIKRSNVNDKPTHRNSVFFNDSNNNNIFGLDISSFGV